MDERTAKRRVSASYLRRIARVWSLVSIGFVLLIFVGQALTSTTQTMVAASELVGLAFFPIGVCFGAILAWRREALGGSICLLSLFAFYAWCRVATGRFPGGPYFALIALPGALFLAASLLWRPEVTAR